MAEYLSAVANYWWAFVFGVVFTIFGSLTFLPLVHRWEETAVVIVRRIFWALAIFCLLVAQFLTWRDSDHAREAAQQRIEELELIAERNRGAYEAKIARLEGRADAVDQQGADSRRLLDEERGRTEALQDELRQQAVEAAKKPIATQAWLNDGLIRLASYRTIEHRTEKAWHGLLLVFQHAGPPGPVALKVTCDCVLEEVHGAYIDLPTGMYTGATELQGPNHAQIVITDPLFRAEAPLLVQLYSKEPVRVTAIAPL